MMQVHHGCWVGTSSLFIGGRKPTYVGILLDSTSKGHLIPGKVVFSIRSFFHCKTLVSWAINAELVMKFNAKHNWIPIYCPVEKSDHVFRGLDTPPPLKKQYLLIF